MLLVRFFFLIILVVGVCSCGKKTALDKFPESDYPRSYPKSDD